MGNDDRPLPLNRDLGDMWSRLEERYQGYWDINRRSVAMPGTTPVVGPNCPPPRTPPSLNCPAPEGIPPGIWEFMRDRFFSALHETLQTFKEDLKCGTFFTKGPSWIEPPISTIRLDRKTNYNTPVPLPAVGPAGPFTDVIVIQVPDLTVGTIWAIAPNVCRADGLNSVQWEELINGAPITDGLYVGAKMPFDNATRDKEPVPVFLPPLSTFTLRARNLSVVQAQDAIARVTGQLLPVRDITTDGTFGQFHVM